MYGWYGIVWYGMVGVVWCGVVMLTWRNADMVAKTEGAKQGPRGEVAQDKASQAKPGQGVSEAGQVGQDAGSF